MCNVILGDGMKESDAAVMTTHGLIHSVPCYLMIYATFPIRAVVVAINGINQPSLGPRDKRPEFRCLSCLHPESRE